MLCVVSERALVYRYSLIERFLSHKPKTKKKKREKKSVKCAFIGLGNVGTGADEAAAPSNRVETKEREKKRRVDQFAVTGNRRTKKGKEGGQSRDGESSDKE